MRGDTKYKSFDWGVLTVHSLYSGGIKGISTKLVIVVVWYWFDGTWVVIEKTCRYLKPLCF